MIYQNIYIINYIKLMDNEYIERVVYIWIDSNIESLENLQ